MDDFVVERVKESVPKINPDIAGGLAVKHMSRAMEYIDSVLKVVSKNFPPELQYDRCERCTPEEEYHFATTKKNGKRYYDIARNDVYLIKLHFNFNGAPLGLNGNVSNRYLYLPYCGPGGAIHLAATQYFMVPMLSDTTFSPSEKGVFIRLLRDKLNFERLQHNILINGEVASTHVTHSLIYHKSKSKNDVKPLIKAECAIAHYLFCKFGVAEVFRRYCNCQVIVGEKEITPEKYKPNEWVICASRQLRPAGYGRLKYVGETNIRIAIRQCDFTPLARSLVGGFFYVVDHFPLQMKPEWVNNTNAWKILLGTILFGNVHVGRIQEDINDHFNSLDEYIDSIVATKLKEDGYHCGDIYDLFYIVLSNIDEWVRKSRNTINTMYDKDLTVLYNILYDTTVAIFKTYFMIKSAAKKGLKERDVLNAMNKHLKPKLVYKLRKGNSCIKQDSYSGDNMFLSITNGLVPQKNNNSQSQKKERPSLRDSSKRLHVSVAEVGGFSNMPKSNPCGRHCINPHLQIDARGRVMRNPQLTAMLDEVQQMITQHLGN